MDVSPVSGSTPPSAATQSLTENFDNFLLMLTAQLQNQDPLNPTDSTEFTNQLVQFSQLEQQISQSDKIDDLVALQLAAQSQNAINFLGKKVEIQSDVTVLEDGKATFTYDMPEGAENATIAILDSDGNIVATFDADTVAGAHEAEWDGLDDQDILQEDGYYTVVVSAVDGDDEPLDDIPTFFTGVASAVWQFEGQTYVTVGPVDVPMSRILSVELPDTPPTA